MAVAESDSSTHSGAAKSPSVISLPTSALLVLPQKSTAVIEIEKFWLGATSSNTAV